ncbi:SGNH hydrolase domain-containing protein [Desulfonema limicola]|uniref:SGNH hydrolase domain-containing protein n=1 Tax=Desulfonema limicola TaxID=45656 RepID=A0A975GEK4_9BACT|nr:hypothetical protein [Desulfonema limicola]QTA78225.1 SGNH hydrolase domain-containing protein [Desulfonema limicola]
MKFLNLSAIFMISVFFWSNMAAAQNADPPLSPVKLIFIHHSTGGNWLADPNTDGPYGGLGTALKNNNYYVSATNYGWGIDSIGDRTDIPAWPEWFTGSSSSSILSDLYTETDQNFLEYGAWTRLDSDPGGENLIIMFKSCFPNSDLSGSPDDLPALEPNDWEKSVSNAKAVYKKILTYFETRQDKLFIVITAPPLRESEYEAKTQTPEQRAANARAFNKWLVNEWLEGYLHKNVAVFDYFNILTHADNHHRIVDNNIEHYTSPQSGNFAFYPSDDSHPSTAGHEKAAAEYVPMLNYFYNNWKNQAGDIVPGNINGSADGKIDLADAVMALQVCAGINVSGLVLAADIKNDKKIGLEEAVYALKTASSLPSTTELIQPSDLQYMGAFTLPDSGDRPLTFAYGGNAMTFNPAGDTANTDQYPGSLFVMGHDRIAWELPTGNQVAEINIPAPVISDNVSELNQAEFIQEFQNVAQGYFTNAEEIVRTGMQYLNITATGPKIHLVWGCHFEPEPPTGTHAWFGTNLSSPGFQGTWFIGNQSFYSVTGYLFEIPALWADQHVNGRYLGTGRFRDGGWSGMGPALFAYRDWTDSGSPAPPGTRLEETVLLKYQDSQTSEDIVNCLKGYQHPDEWEGVAWIKSPAGKTGVLAAGTKATGNKYWYGWVNPAGPEYPCIEQELLGTFTLCRNADGTPCPGEDLTECQGHNDYRGWWSSSFNARFIFYNPDDLAKSASGEINSWEPQPYAKVDIDEHLFLNPANVEPDMLGTGVQRRQRIGPVTYDHTNNILYVMEMFADEAKPVVHVWKMN